jgi:hypothetical protein
MTPIFRRGKVTPPLMAIAAGLCLMVNLPAVFAQFDPDNVQVRAAIARAETLRAALSPQPGHP